MLDEVGMSVGQPASPPPSLSLVGLGLGLGGGTLKAPVGAFLLFCPPKLAVGDS